jgi:hypothetical protein
MSRLPSVGNRTSLLDPESPDGGVKPIRLEECSALRLGCINGIHRTEAGSRKLPY